MKPAGDDMKRKLFAAAVMAGTGVSAAPADPVFKPIVDMRLRYENVEQRGFARDADAVTARVRAGADIRILPATRLLIEGEGTLALVERYNSTTNRKTLFPVVADPETIELNRLQIQNKSIPGTTLTGGRQRIALDDQRFVGAVGFRDNEQTFDAARIETAPIKNLKIDLTYAWSNRTIFGVDSPIERIHGDNVFANVAYTTELGTLSGFGYWIDQDARTRRQFSSQTYGVRFAGKYALSKTAALTYALSYARQRDAYDNPVRYGADYGLAEIGVTTGGLGLGAGYEVLGADDGRAGSSFQTPLATLHKFQGWADKFLVTPANGIRDAYASAGYTLTKVGPFASIGILAVYHDYRSDRAGLHYGDEVDVQLLARFGKRTTAILKLADYNAKSFATDTRKLWATVEYVF